VEAVEAGIPDRSDLHHQRRTAGGAHPRPLHRQPAADVVGEAADEVEAGDAAERGVGEGQLFGPHHDVDRAGAGHDVSQHGRIRESSPPRQQLGVGARTAAEVEIPLPRFEADEVDDPVGAGREQRLHRGRGSGAGEPTRGAVGPAEAGGTGGAPATHHSS